MCRQSKFFSFRVWTRTRRLTCLSKNSNGMAAPMPPKHHWPKQPKAKCSPRPRPEIAVIATGQLGSLAAYLHTESHGLANQKLSFHIMKTIHLH